MEELGSTSGEKRVEAGRSGIRSGACSGGGEYLVLTMCLRGGSYGGKKNDVIGIAEAREQWKQQRRMQKRSVRRELRELREWGE